MKIRLSKRSFWPVALMLAGLLAGHAETPNTVETSIDKASTSPTVSDSDLVELAAGNSAFATDLYNALGQQTKGNFFYSPYSISSALAMTYAGARGETEQQMATTLHFTLPQTGLHPAFSTLNAGLISRKEEQTFKLHIANALWGQKGFEFLPTYINTLDEYYSAGLHTVDFANATETARKTINKWVSDKTQSKIKNLIPTGVLSPVTRLVLTNAIYFKGKWETPFMKESTGDATFNLLDGNTVSVPTMNKTHSFNYVEGKGYQAIELPYRDSDAAMLIVLPKVGKFDEIESSFSAEMVNDIASKLTNQRVYLALPKFTFASEFFLADVLMKMGMTAAFGNADFSGMTGKRDLSISQVVHKAFVAVDEEGTEAAAATAIVTKGMVFPEHEMTVNRPFIFMIRDTRTGTILFSGRVTNPLQS